jgi:hypothetical protein
VAINNDMDPIKQSIFNKARKDKFLIVLTPPKVVREIDDPVTRSNEHVNNDAIQFSVYGAVIPQFTVPAVDIDYGGQTFSFSSHARPSFENIDLNYTVDNRYNNYWILYKWINVMNHNLESIFYNDKVPYNGASLNREGIVMDPEVIAEYGTTITIYGLDEYDKRVIQFDYIGALPVSVGQITFNDRDPMEMESTFTFAFSQFDTKLLPS